MKTIQDVFANLEDNWLNKVKTLETRLQKAQSQQAKHTKKLQEERHKNSKQLDIVKEQTDKLYVEIETLKTLVLHQQHQKEIMQQDGNNNDEKHKQQIQKLKTQILQLSEQNDKLKEVLDAAKNQSIGSEQQKNIFEIQLANINEINLEKTKGLEDKINELEELTKSQRDKFNEFYEKYKTKLKASNKYIVITADTEALRKRISELEILVQEKEKELIDARKRERELLQQVTIQETIFGIELQELGEFIKEMKEREENDEKQPVEAYHKLLKERESRIVKDKERRKIGLAVGGAKDVNNFRKYIEKNIIPWIHSITYNGLLNEYYFDTTSRKHDIDEGVMLFYPSYCYAMIKKLEFNFSEKPIQDKDGYEYYMSVGLNSNIEEDEFKRKALNLVILLDISGSMRHSFGSLNKMESAKKAVISILNKLTSRDRLGIVLFNYDATVIHKLRLLTDVNLDELKVKIMNITAEGGTNLENGYKKAMKLLYVDMLHDDNRILMITDAQPTDVSDKSLIQMVEVCANNIDNRIYTTFIGVGLDFNVSLIETISGIRGCNYLSIKNNKQFDNKINDEFEYLMTPLVFNVCLKLKCEGDVCQIEKVYGSGKDEENNIMNNGEITKIATLFASKSCQETGDISGGIQLIKLKKNNKHCDNNNNNINVKLEVVFEDRNGTKYENIQNVTFKALKKSKINDHDMIEEDEDEVNFYDNKGIRKAILLCKYIELIRKWIDADIDSRKLYQKQLFSNFMHHFKKEMIKCNDNTLEKELIIIEKIASCNIGWKLSAYHNNQYDKNTICPVPPFGYDKISESVRTKFGNEKIITKWYYIGNDTKNHQVILRHNTIKCNKKNHSKRVIVVDGKVRYAQKSKETYFIIKNGADELKMYIESISHEISNKYKYTLKINDVLIKDLYHQSISCKLPLIIANMKNAIPAEIAHIIILYVEFPLS